MKKISDSKELNEYYSKVNGFIDEYIKSHKVSPTEIYRYINKNLTRFLEKFGISDVEKIEKIVKDVIEHRKHMEMDKVFNFGDFSVKLNESMISILPSSVEHEKVLADFYNTSLGHIEVLDKESHLFELEDFGEKKRVIIFSTDEVEMLKGKFKKNIIEEIKKKTLSLISLNDVSLDNPIKISLEGVISDSNLSEVVESKLDKDMVLSLIGKFIPESLFSYSLLSRVEFRELFKGYYIWEL